jgi:hypothetical protein
MRDAQGSNPWTEHLEGPNMTHPEVVDRLKAYKEGAAQLPS